MSRAQGNGIKAGLETVNSGWHIATYIFAIIFACGIAYTKIDSMEGSDKEQNKLLGDMRIANIRTADSVERLEASQKLFSETMIEMQKQMNERLKHLEEKVIRNEMRIDSIEKGNSNVSK